ncbi:hypothetical protein ABT126_45365 [Streptomyces sp. NPDC002012]|uniref:hypothetical protein n=1 Tax=Streptomyces sp. NPDC002012 TaxID=3154532 RepID=UPI00332CC2D8
MREPADVAVVGPRTGVHRGQGTRAAGAMLSTFSELEPQHDAAQAGMETAERLAAHQAYPAWLERIEAMGGGTVQAPSGTWVFAPAGRRSCLDPIAAAARAAGHSVEEHDASSVPSLRAPASSAGALWPPTEARGVDVAVRRGHRADGPAGSVPHVHDGRRVVASVVREPGPRLG